MFAEAYELARSHVVSGGALPDPVPLFVEHKAESPQASNPGAAEAAMATIAGVLGIGDDDEPAAIARTGVTFDEE
jgi:hypothetical protein